MSDLDADLRTLVDAAAAPVTPGGGRRARRRARRAPRARRHASPTAGGAHSWLTASLVVVAVATVGIVVATDRAIGAPPRGTPTAAPRWRHDGS